MKQNGYRFINDPIFIGGWLLYFGLYFAQQFLSVPTWLISYGRDLLLVPCVLPIIVTGLIRLKIRTSSPPATVEILLALLIWSIMFELLGPKIFDHAVSDGFDILAYCAGGIISALYWHTSYR
jgi:hypothetical protein